MNNNQNQITRTVTPEKQQFIENVQKWVLIDTQLKIINEKTKKLRDMKHGLTDEICNYTKEKSMSKIGISDGELRIYDKKEYTPLSFGYIETCLANIISDKSQVDYIIKYLKENRETSTSPDIRHHIQQKNQNKDE